MKKKKKIKINSKLDTVTSSSLHPYWPLLLTCSGQRKFTISDGSESDSDLESDEEGEEKEKEESESDNRLIVWKVNSQWITQEVAEETVESTQTTDQIIEGSQIMESTQTFETIVEISTPTSNQNQSIETIIENQVNIVQNEDKRMDILENYDTIYLSLSNYFFYCYFEILICQSFGESNLKKKKKNENF